MIINSHSADTVGGVDQANRNDTLSGTDSSDSNMERLHHGRLVKLGLSDGKSVYAKLVVVVYSILSCVSARLCLSDNSSETKLWAK